MRIQTLFYTFFLATALFAAEKNQDTAVYGNVAADSTLDKLMSIPGVEAIYKECDANNQTKADVPDCIWEKVKKNSALKKQVEAKYQEIASGKATTNTSGRSPASAIKESKKESLTSRQMTIATDYNSDPGVRALSDFFGQKLAEVFQTSDEDLKKNQIISVNHEKFISLYKTELGKSIVNSLTGYCLNVDFTDCESNGSCKYKNDRDVREKNIESLKTTNFDTGADRTKWVSCITGISKNCYEDAAKDSESKNQACLVMDFIKSARKSIIVAEKQTEFYEKLKNDGPKVAISNFKAPDAEKSTNDSLTQITSSDMEKEFVGADGKKTSIKNVNEALAKEVDNCVKNGQIKNEADCKKFLNTNAEEQDKTFAEFSLIQNIEKENLDKKLEDDKNVAAYLKEEGYSDDQISDMTKDKNNLEQLKEEIKKRYAAEKKALIAEMRAKIDKKTTNKNDDFKTSTGKLEKIKEDFSKRTKDMGDLIKFTNIVSAYLEVGDKNKKDKKTSRNTASLFAEVESMKEEDAKELKKQIKAADLKDSKTNSELGVDTINCYFTGTYQNQTKCKN